MRFFPAQFGSELKFTLFPDTTFAIVFLARIEESEVIGCHGSLSAQTGWLCATSRISAIAAIFPQDTRGNEFVNRKV